MLRKKINFKLGKDPTGFLVPGIAVGLLGFLSIAALNSLNFRLGSEAYAEEVTVSAVLTPSVTLSMPPSVNGDLEPTVDGVFKNIATVARVQIANSEYYNVSVSGNPDMVGVANGNAAKITAIPGQKKASEFTANTWGYNVSKNAAGTKTAVVANANTIYSPLSTTATTVGLRQATTNNIADDYYSLNFGAKVDTSIPADTYTGRVTISVTASPIIATEYSLTYDANGATGGTVPAKQVYASYEKNYEFTVSGNTGTTGSNGLTKTGYTFLGWADTANATTAQYTANSKITVPETAKDKTIYAVWKQNTSYSITYNGNGNTGGTVPTAQTASNINVSQEFTVPSDSLTKTGYNFLGWAESNTATSATYVAGNKITLTTSKPAMTLYAVWQKINNYSVAYNGNGNTSGTAPTTQSANSTDGTYEFTAAAQGNLVKTGYTFLGWSESSTATSASYAAGSTKVQLTSANPSKTLYAVWKAVPINTTTMQGLTADICKAAAVGETKQLTDNRASTNKDTSSLNKYWVTKLKDGNCWMTQNLDYAATTPTSTSSTGTGSSDTGKIWDDGLKVISAMSYAGSATSVTGKTASADSAFVGPISGNEYNAHYLTGNYYQYSAAKTACSSIGSQWNLPTSNQATTVNGSLNKLLSGVNQNTILASPYYFPPVGYVAYDAGKMDYVGAGGSYWSSTDRDSATGYRLSFISNGFNPSVWDYRYNGLSVRCYVNGN